MVSDPGGRILFLRRTAAFRIADTTDLRPNETPWRGTLEVDVFDSSSAYRGRLVTPKDVRTRGFSFGQDLLWLTHEGASGELYLGGVAALAVSMVVGNRLTGACCRRGQGGSAAAMYC